MSFLKRQNETTRNIYNVLCQNGFTGSYINEIILEDNILSLSILLPPNKEIIQFEALLSNIKEEMKAIDIKITHNIGKKVYLKLSYIDLNKITFNKDYFTEDSLLISIQTPFGKTIIDFRDSASCHMLFGGATRTGKTNTLLFLITVLHYQNNANTSFYISTVKPKDFYCFQKVKNITITKESNDLLNVLEQIQSKYDERFDLINSDELYNCIDAKDVIKKHPKYKQTFSPIFLVIDEYARYADDKKIQKEITKLVETAGYLNIHVIISTQRSDAKTVLNPRIRANLLCSLAFTTRDKDNSKLIIGVEGAERLGKIAGRGLLNNKDIELIQIPYMDYEEIIKLMKDFKEDKNETKHKKDSQDKRSKNNELARKMENLFHNSNSDTII